MASGTLYPPPSAFSGYDLGVYPANDYHPEYTPYAPSRPLPWYAQQQQGYQVWSPPSRYSTGSYPDSSAPGSPGSPIPLRHSFADDPAFAPDPSTNPDNWYRPMDALSMTAPPPRTYSGLDLPHGFVPQSAPFPNAPYRAHSYHEDIGPSFGPQPVYIAPNSVTPSSSTSGSTTSIARPPRSSVRSPDYPPSHSDSPFRSTLPTDAPYTLPDERQVHPRTGKHRPKRRSPPAAQQMNDQVEQRSGLVFPLIEYPPADVPPPPSLAEQPKESRGRTSSRPTPPDLDPIDELDKTNPHGYNVHHKGPYEAVAAILNETNPIDSPLLRVKGIQQQVSSSALARPSRTKREPNANPMSLNLQPGQILQSSIYQPTQPTPFPLEYSLGAHHGSHDIRLPRGPVEHMTTGYNTATTGSPLRRNQTLPPPSLARGSLEQSYRNQPSGTSEVQRYQHPDDHQPNSQPVDHQTGVPPHSGRRRSAQIYRHSPEHRSAPHNNRPQAQLGPVISVTAPEALLATPDLDQRFSRTLYLTNPDETIRARTHPSGASLLPLAHESSRSSHERQMEQPPRGHHDSIYGGQTARAPTDSERRNRGHSRNSPPSAVITSDQESPRRYEPPSQTVAAMNGQYIGKAGSTTSSSSSTLAPRHLPKRLVMPTPLANSAETAPPMMPSASHSNDGRSGQVLRKRGQVGDRPQPQRSQSLPSETASRGMFSFFRFGKSSKPTAREVHVTEKSKVGTSEKAERRVRIREEPRKLSKRK
ncbi:hypothetical protein F5148DRAFT_246542 [Russula earlei]|uniref:Uncharacterized protein n=1 Tax=Russula earlei TaxID=71964 RepID=A0ACC0U4Z3_9AGAM|nr:hypothetical protein F5148DRAFT_246542 [Russula earlei]